MNLKKILLLLVLLPNLVVAKIEIYDDLKDAFDDAEFKSIFSHSGMAACIWVQDYRKNTVHEKKVSKETDIVMHNRCTEAAISVSANTAQSIEPVHIDIRHTGRAPEFSSDLKNRYKQLFPHWKQTMQKELEQAQIAAQTEYVCDTNTTQGLNECTKNVGKKPEKSNPRADTFNDSFNTLKEFTGIFSK